jgi:hypothetical protein
MSGVGGEAARRSALFPTETSMLHCFKVMFHFFLPSFLHFLCIFLKNSNYQSCSNSHKLQLCFKAQGKKMIRLGDLEKGENETTCFKIWNTMFHKVLKVTFILHITGDIYTYI